MKAKLRIYLESQFLDEAINRSAFSGEENILKGRFLMLLQSQVTLHWNMSKTVFINKAQNNPYYKVLFKKEFEGQVVSHFQSDLTTFLNDDLETPSVIYVQCEYVDLSNHPNVQFCSAISFYTDLERIFLHAKFDLEYQKTSREQFLQQIDNRSKFLQSDRVILNDGYLMHESRKFTIDSKLNLKSWLKSVTQTTKEVFFCYGHIEDKDVTYELIEGMNDFQKVGLINGQIHNRFLLTRFFYITTGNGFNAFDEAGKAIRKDEFIMESVYIPKDKPGDKSAYQFYYGWYQEVQRTVNIFKKGRNQYLELKGECFFNEG